MTGTASCTDRTVTDLPLHWEWRLGSLGWHQTVFPNCFPERFFINWYIVEAGFELVILVPQPPKFYNNKHAPNAWLQASNYLRVVTPLDSRVAAVIACYLVPLYLVCCVSGE